VRNPGRPAKWLAGFVFLFAAGLPADSIDDKIPPGPTRYVTDRAGVLPADSAEAINSRLEQYEKETSNQFIVWVDRRIPEGFALEDFAVRAFKKWGVGQKDKKNGVALFVFVDDRKMRIEVGYGLEGALPDVIAHRIQEDEILPRFRTSDYAGGIEAGVNGIIAATKGEYKGTGRTVAESRRRPSGGGGGSSSCVSIGFPIFFFIVLPFLFRRRYRTFGGRGWSSGGWTIGPWIGGGGGGGWSGGGGGDFGGGFSGGGGDSGGGGSSGSW
jgi:uncharacterized protein